MSVCTACGYPRKLGARFCAGCGALLRGPFSAVAPGADAAYPAAEDPFGGLFGPARDDTARDGTAPVDVAPFDVVPFDVARGDAGRLGPGTAPPGQRKIIIAALAVAVVLAAVGVTAGVVMNRPHVPPSSPVAQRSPTGRASATTTAPRTASPAAPRTASPAAPRPAGPAASGRGNSTVAVSPSAAANPAVAPIVNLLTSYFTAINKHDYAAYSSLLEPQVQQQMTASQFATGYQSTMDSAATLTGISTAADGSLQAAVTFTSHQDPSDSPDNSGCTNWSITLFLEQGGGGYLVGQAPQGYQATHQPC